MSNRHLVIKLDPDRRRVIDAAVAELRRQGIRVFHDAEHYPSKWRPPNDYAND